MAGQILNAKSLRLRRYHTFNRLRVGRSAYEPLAYDTSVDEAGRPAYDTAKLENCANRLGQKRPKEKNI